MKKIVSRLICLFASGAVYALPIGNPSEPNFFLEECYESYPPCIDYSNLWDLRMGFYGDYVFNRNLKIDNNEGSGHFQSARMDTNAAYFAFNFIDRFVVFGTFGASHLQLRQNEKIFTSTLTPSIESELVFSTEFSWSIGARCVLWSCGCFQLGLEGQFFETIPHIDYFIDYNSGAITHFKGVKSKYREWQVGTAISYKIATTCPSVALIPYIGVKWSQVKLNLDRTAFFPDPTDIIAITLLDAKSSKNWGYALGLTFTFLDCAAITIEGRFADEKAVHVNGQVQF